MRQLITYQDFAVVLERDEDTGYRTRVSFAAGDSAPAAFEPPVDLDRLSDVLADLEGFVRGGAGELRDVRRREEAGKGTLDPETLGGGLYDALFAGGVRDAYQKRGGAAEEEGTGFRLRLVLDPDEPALSALPWELLYDRDRQRFLGHDPRTPIVRYLRRPATADPRLEPVVRPLRVLVADAAPAGTAPLDLEGERRKVAKALGEGRDVEVRYAETATFEDLRRALRDFSPHVFHFMGHGTFEDETGEGALVLTGPDGDGDQVTGRDLSVVLSGCHELRLAVLNACEAGAVPRKRGLDPFSGVASSLLLRGELPAVVAMQFPITDEAAVAFGGAFYEALAKGDPVEAAVAEGRQAIFGVDRKRGTYEWATPVLYLRVDHGQIFRLEPQEDDEPPGIANRILAFGDLIEEVTRDFVGRRFVFRAIEEFVAANDRGYFQILGDPGIGKTALMAELARTNDYLHHFNLRREEAYNNAEAFLANLCAQLVVRYRLPYNALPPEATRDSGFLVRLLGEVSDRLEDGEKLLVLVDALDEVVTAASSEANVLHLPERLPRGVFFVLTGRRDVYRRLTVKSPYREYALDPASDDNRRDVRDHLGHSVERPGIRGYLDRNQLTEQGFVEDLAERSEGNFMYLYHVLREIAEGAYQNVDLEAIPVGLGNYYEDHWRRMQELCSDDWQRFQLPVLAALTLAKRPVSLMAVADLTRIGDLARVLSVLLAWDGFLHKIPHASGSPRLKLYRLYHETFHEFIREKDEVGLIDLAGARRKINEVYEENLRQDTGSRADSPLRPPLP